MLKSMRGVYLCVKPMRKRAAAIPKTEVTPRDGMCRRTGSYAA